MDLFCNFFSRALRLFSKLCQFLEFDKSVVKSEEITRGNAMAAKLVRSKARGKSFCQLTSSFKSY